jgi:hypothetical protein
MFRQPVIVGWRREEPALIKMICAGAAEGPVVNIEISFPVIGFWENRDDSDSLRIENFRGFVEWSDLQTMRQRELRRDGWIGMLLVDSDSRTWVMRSVRSLGFRTPFFQRVLLTLFNDHDNIEHEVRCELDEIGVTPFSEVRERVCRAIEKNPDDWMDDEILAGESGPPIKLEDVLEALKAAVRRTTNLQELFDSLNLDQIYPGLQAAAALEFDAD